LNGNFKATPVPIGPGGGGGGGKVGGGMDGGAEWWTIAGSSGKGETSLTFLISDPRKMM
jgi:hypothetical protein